MIYILITPPWASVCNTEAAAPLGARLTNAYYHSELTNYFGLTILDPRLRPINVLTNCLEPHLRWMYPSWHILLANKGLSVDPLVLHPEVQSS